MDFHKGDRIEIVEGPFKGFEGIVDAIAPENDIVTVVLTLFGQPTPVEVEDWQLEKLSKGDEQE